MSFPEEHETYASRWSAAGLFLAGIFFAWTSFSARGGEYPTVAWILTVVFVVCLPILFMTILRPAGLKLSAEGMTMTGWNVDRFYPWESISKIRVQKMPGRGYFLPKRVWFQIDSNVMGPTESKLSLLTGGNGMLPSNYGYSAKQMAEMLQAFQARALARQTS